MNLRSIHFSYALFSGVLVDLEVWVVPFPGFYSILSSAKKLNTCHCSIYDTELGSKVRGNVRLFSLTAAISAPTRLLPRLCQMATSAGMHRLQGRHADLSGAAWRLVTLSSSRAPSTSLLGTDFGPQWLSHRQPVRSCCQTFYCRSLRRYE